MMSKDHMQADANEAARQQRIFEGTTETIQIMVRPATDVDWLKAYHRHLSEQYRNHKAERDYFLARMNARIMAAVEDRLNELSGSYNH